MTDTQLTSTNKNKDMHLSSALTKNERFVVQISQAMNQQPTNEAGIAEIIEKMDEAFDTWDEIRKELAMAYTAYKH